MSAKLNVEEKLKKIIFFIVFAPVLVFLFTKMLLEVLYYRQVKVKKIRKWFQGFHKHLADLSIQAQDMKDILNLCGECFHDAIEVGKSEKVRSGKFIDGELELVKKYTPQQALRELMMGNKIKL